MESLGQDWLGRQIFVHTITETGEWETPPIEGKDYACLLVLGAGAGSSDICPQVARSLIGTRCRYFVYHGADWEVWWDEVLRANRETPEYESPDEILLMEDQHGLDAPLGEVLFAFFAMCDYDDVTIENFLILFIRVDTDVRSKIVKAVKERVWDVSAEDSFQ